MTTPQFTDPEWWQQRPRLTPDISTTKMVVGTIVPAILIVAVAIAVFTGRDKSTAKAQAERSVAAFEVCMTAHGLSPATKSGSDAQQQALADCRETLPSGTHVGSFAVGESADQQFSECMRDAGSGRQGGGGRFGQGGGPSSSFENSLAICRGLIQNGQQSAPIVPASTSTTPPIA